MPLAACASTTCSMHRRHSMMSQLHHLHAQCRQLLVPSATLYRWTGEGWYDKSFLFLSLLNVLNFLLCSRCTCIRNTCEICIQNIHNLKTRRCEPKTKISIVRMDQKISTKLARSRPQVRAMSCYCFNFVDGGGCLAPPPSKQLSHWTVGRSSV